MSLRSEITTDAPLCFELFLARALSRYWCADAFQMPFALEPLATLLWSLFFFSRRECRFSLLCLDGHPPGGHPDKDGHHLRIVAGLLKKHLENYGNGGVEEAGIFWDFGSLFQKEHEGNQKQLFDEGLRASNLWYGSTKTTVWTRSQSAKSCCV